MKDPLPSDIFRPGQILNNTYEIIGITGRGGTGEVYLARNQITERDVAIKALNARFSGNADYVELMKREEQMRNIIHDAVVRYSECSRSDAGHVFLVMDHIEGPSLNQVMLDQRLDDRALMVIAHRVLEGLAATHDRGIVHRDLSPDNIILRHGKPEAATIIDFGIAKDTAAGARTIVGNEFAGKYEYAAPEQLEGKADYRSDLYGLGALLLAAARQEVPQVGTSPGEIVRMKHKPLDTSGIAPPLKDLIDWLTDPDPARRPQSATEALAQLDRWLKPDTHRARPDGRKPKRRGGMLSLTLGALALAAAIGGGLWAAGLFAPGLPVAAPYVLNASFETGSGGTLAGNAPDEAAAQTLRAAFTQASGSAPPDTALTLAGGAPGPAWSGDVEKLFQLAAPLSQWELAVTDNAANLAGIAPDATTRDAVRAGLGGWPSAGGMSLQADLVAGPETLGWAALQPYLDQLATCGPLGAPPDQPAEFALFDTIAITGYMANPTDAETIRSTLAPVIGDRSLDIRATSLNEDLCRIRAALPPAATGPMSIWLGRGATGEAALTGVFHTGDNPVVDIQIPASISGASLWVMVVDNTGKVFHVLPNINQTDTLIDNLGQVESGIRRVRVLWSLDQLKENPNRLAVTVSEGNYGKSEVIAILSKTPLYDLRRPRDESVDSVAESLAETLKGREDQIISIAARIIDARQ